MPPTAEPDTAQLTGEDVLDWLRTAPARAYTARLVRHRQLPGGDAMVDDILAEAAVAVLARSRSRTAPPLVVDRPGAYGTSVIRSVVRRQLRDDEIVALADSDGIEDDGGLPIDPTHGDGARMVLEQLGSSEPWLGSASLTCLTLLMHPQAVSASWPRPRAGADADQARVWPALWLAGERHLFDGDESQRRLRARRIQKVRARVELAFARLRLDAGADDV